MGHRQLIVGILRLGAIASLLASWSGCDSNAPSGVHQLRLPADVFLGETSLGGQVEGHIVLTNPTTSLVRIDRVVSSCGCTALAEGPLEVPAQGEIRVAIKMRPGNRPTLKASRVTFVGRDGQTAEVTVRGESVSPFPSSVAGGAGEAVRVPVHASYNGAFQTLEAYLYPSDAPLVFTIATNVNGGQVVQFENVTAPGAIDFVFRLTQTPDVAHQVAVRVDALEDAPEHALSTDKRRH